MLRTIVSGLKFVSNAQIHRVAGLPCPKRLRAGGQRNTREGIKDGELAHLPLREVGLGRPPAVPLKMAKNLVKGLS